MEPEASLFIGKRDLGQVNNYYLGDIITDEEVAAVQAAAEDIGVEILNTRYASGVLLHYGLFYWVGLHSVFRRTDRTILFCWLHVQIPNQMRYIHLRVAEPN